MFIFFCIFRSIHYVQRVEGNVAFNASLSEWNISFFANIFEIVNQWRSRIVRLEKNVLPADGGKVCGRSETNPSFADACNDAVSDYNMQTFALVFN